MTTISTRRHPIKFYTLLIVSVLVLCVMATGLLIKSIDTLQKEQIETKAYFFSFFCLLIYCFAFASVYFYWRNSPHVSINDQTIKIGNQVYSLNDIKGIALTGKVPFPYFVNFPMEGMALLLNNGSERFLYDDMYSNLHQVKSMLEQVIVNEQEYNSVFLDHKGRNGVRLELEETFKGIQLINFRGILLWGAISFLAIKLFVSAQIPSVAGLIIIGLMAALFFVSFSWEMHYFGLSKDYLIVRNHNFIWKSIVYGLSEIKEVVFETDRNRPNCMRVITKDFRNKLYPAGTLRDKTWHRLKSRLEAKGEVRNECIAETVIDK